MSRKSVTENVQEQLREEAESRQGLYIFGISVAALIFLVGLVMFGSAALTKPNGEPLFQDPGEVIGGVVTLAGTLGVAILTFVKDLDRRSRRLEQDTAIVKENVQNSHDTGLRDNLDDNHREVIQQQEAILQTQATQGHVMTGINEALRTLTVRLDGMADKIDIVQEHGVGAAKDIRGLRVDVGRLNDAVNETSRSTQANSLALVELDGRVDDIEKSATKTQSRQSAALRKLQAITETLGIEDTDRTARLIARDRGSADEQGEEG